MHVVTFDLVAYQVLYLREFAFVLGADESEGASSCAGATGSSHAMYVVVRLEGDIVVYDESDAFQVYPASEHVCRDDRVDLMHREVIERRSALGLASARMDACCLVSPRMQVLEKGIGPSFGADEDDGLLPALLCQERLEKLRLATMVHLNGELPYAACGEMPGILIDEDGMAHKSLKMACGFAVYGCGKEQGLAFLRAGADDLLHLGEESHIEHPVGFV